MAEICSKITSPLTSMILARLIAPEEFGVIAIINMFISSLDILTDGGFGKYIIQRNFKDERQMDEVLNVAFWTNFFLSLLISIVIILNSSRLADFFSNSHLDLAFKVMTISVLSTSFSSIQLNILRRHLEYKKLFQIRMIVAFLPLIVTVSLAFYLKNFWALLIGQTVVAVTYAILLFINSVWKPKLYYSFSVLKEMFSFSFWSLMEASAHWAIFWIDTAIISLYYSGYYIGIYKNSQMILISIFSIVSATMSPVLMSTLSRIADQTEYFKVYQKIFSLISYIVIPMGLGLIFFPQIVTNILLGNQWEEAYIVFQYGGFMMMNSILFYSFPAEVFKSKGQPIELFKVQFLYLLCLIPGMFYFSKIGFNSVVYFRSLSILLLVGISLYFLNKLYGWSIKEIILSAVTGLKSSLLLIIVGTLFWILNVQVQGTLASISYVALIGLLHSLFVFVFFKKDILELLKVLSGNSSY